MTKELLTKGLMLEDEISELSLCLHTLNTANDKFSGVMYYFKNFGNDEDFEYIKTYLIDKINKKLEISKKSFEGL